MSEELEALERIGSFTITMSYLNKEGAVSHLLEIKDECREDYKIIKKALEDLEYLREKTKVQENTIKMLMQENHKMKNDTKALEIIKEKGVNVGNFIYWLKQKPRTYEDYLQDFYQEHWYLHYKDNDDNRCKFYKLTQEEFDLLKEALVNE